MVEFNFKMNIKKRIYIMQMLFLYLLKINGENYVNVSYSYFMKSTKYTKLGDINVND